MLTPRSRISACRFELGGSSADPSFIAPLTSVAPVIHPLYGIYWPFFFGTYVIGSMDDTS